MGIKTVDFSDGKPLRKVPYNYKEISTFIHSVYILSYLHLYTLQSSFILLVPLNFRATL